MNSQNVDTAKLLSRKSKLHFRHGCLILKKNKILSSGVNEEGNRVMGKTVPCIHAEMGALASLKRSTPLLRQSSYRFLPSAAKKQWFKEARHLCSPDGFREQSQGVEALLSLSSGTSEFRAF